MPQVNTQAMQSHLDEIAKLVPPSRHAVIVRDRAAWHTPKKLTLPSHISLLHLPAISPELNPVEHVWNGLPQHYWANRAFEHYEAIVHSCCQAWNAFAALPNTLQSIGSRTWACLHK